MAKQKLSVLPSKIFLTDSTSDSREAIPFDTLPDSTKADIRRTMSRNIGNDLNQYYSQHFEEWIALLKNLP